MRLINAKTLELEDFTMRDIAARPQYAILSHTWAIDASLEVLFADMTDIAHAELTKPAGFKKIRYTCSQALKDGLTHAWIDTCCIDKSSSAELSEAINSMFQWYKQSAICYVFIADASGHRPVMKLDHLQHEGTGITEMLDLETLSDETKKFAASRWFTRGWALQELLAPSKVLFYGAAWELIGDLEDAVIGNIVSHTTKIPREVLQSHVDLSRVSVAKRMSWAASRRTTREEDAAYCLLGIFGVNLPLLYGEGSRAFRRLQEEIARNSSDHSILTWKRPLEGSFDSIFASKTSDFVDCSYINRRNQNYHNASGPNDIHSRGTYNLTKDGLSIEVRVLYDSGIFAILDCYDERDSSKYVCLKLCPLNYVGVHKTVVFGAAERAVLTLKKLKRIPLKRILLANRLELRESAVYAKFYDARVRVSRSERERWSFRVKEVYPPPAWNMTNMSCRPSEKQALRRVKTGDSDNAFNEPELSTRGLVLELSRKNDAPSTAEGEVDWLTWNVCILFSYAEDDGTLGLWSALYGRVHVEELGEQSLESLCRQPLLAQEVSGAIWTKVRTRKICATRMSGDGPTISAEIMVNDASATVAVSLLGSSQLAVPWQIAAWRLGMLKTLLFHSNMLIGPMFRYGLLNAFSRNVVRVGDLPDLAQRHSKTTKDPPSRGLGLSSQAHGELLPRQVLKKSGMNLSRVEWYRQLLESTWFDLWNDLDDEETEMRKESEKKNQAALPKSVMSGLSQVRNGLSAAKVDASR